MHPLYRKLGFDTPDHKVMERPARRQEGAEPDTWR
jgi:hypothetical protein